ncbi:EAL and HDOD domain-containing protein [Ectothiorhodospira shaposhnikovii]|uniref:EAL and HDOD domain-containing protein n=1 Tax=Ectothiorhodospira shaposhnikovii TaxID=1054 RepID=UPI001EE7FABB|nr:HDOD domain-containing protein [Ectothiorhodospira shaposhnikovii]MCG5513694.1 HDOD domain-containing protein [Ectothiorhodospira shaposhnikovii]
MEETMEQAASHNDSTYIARQPIYNRQLGVYAYELLFRSASSLRSATGSDAATSHVILSVFGEIGLDTLVGSRLAAINMTPRLLRELESLNVPAGRLIVDLPPDLPGDEATLETLKRLAGRGYILALDDYAPGGPHDRLLSMVHQVKVDTARLKPDDLRSVHRRLARHDVSIVAEKVESLEDYEFLRDLGFHYFQGYFLSRPRLFRAVGLEAGKLTVLRLLAGLQDPTLDVHQLQHLIAQDAGLAVKLLRLINSPFFGLSREVDSLARAILILGRRKLATWACMLVIRGLEDRPAGLVQLALERAALCERLAGRAGRGPVENYFTCGLFSALDLIMERPLEQIIPPLPLGDAVKAALLRGEGEMAEVLACAGACERGDIEAAGFAGLSARDISEVTLEAGRWADEVLSVSLTGKPRH